MQHLSPDSTLQNGKYRIARVLGQGGFGITYLAEQPLMLNRKVAIKEFFLKDYFSRNETTAHVTCSTGSTREMAETYRRKFIKEAQLQLQMHHPNLVDIYDIFEENNTAYYVMEYVEGKSLADIVKRRGALPEEEAIGYIKKVAEALKYIHSHRVAHLDVKPANILVRKSDGEVKLIDFGTSKHFDSRSGEQTTITTPCYSPGYAPIEQYKAGGVSTFTPQTDIYALGATLFKLITGQAPPDANVIFNDGIPAMSGVSFSLCKTIEMAMQPKKADRPQCVEDFLNNLGSITTESSSDSVKQYREAAEQGYADAQNRLGVCHEKGEGVEQSYTEAVKQYRKAAERGNADAQYDLGVCYENGEGVEQSATEAVKWYRKAAEQGNAGAQYKLGVCYENGEGVEQSDTEAVKWYRKAAEQGYAEAQYKLGYYYRSGTKAVKWYRMAAEQGNASAQYELGVCYKNGKGVEQSATEAAKWYRKAAERGDADAQSRLGACYENGEGVEMSHIEAVKWYRKAAVQGHISAKNHFRIKEELIVYYSLLSCIVVLADLIWLSKKSHTGLAEMITGISPISEIVLIPVGIYVSLNFCKAASIIQNSLAKKISCWNVFCFYIVCLGQLITYVLSIYFLSFTTDTHTINICTGVNIGCIVTSFISIRAFLYVQAKSNEKEKWDALMPDWLKSFVPETERKTRLFLHLGFIWPLLILLPFPGGCFPCLFIIPIATFVVVCMIPIKIFKYIADIFNGKI